ncbi:Coronatine-insensitive protein 1 [Forsythia ovata]|uniref:Coronatine-insensitive protein 1 n=1 Tax=Forsythia ovata TaxID=205694 RepID=A0ABD1X129_9LAMI
MSNTSSSTGSYSTVWECVIPYVQEPQDRGAVSLVCKRWYEIDAVTRNHVTIALCYAASPDLLLQRFPNLESLKLKGQPRAAMFNLIPSDWGGYVTPWIEKIVESFKKMKSLHLRRMIVKDSDLELLAASATGKALEVLKLDKCSGFSTDGLLHISRSCRNLRTLVMEESTIVENDGEWLHELALKNTVLENLNFYMTDLVKVASADLELIAKNCASLVSMKITDCDILELVGFFRFAAALEEFCGGSFSSPPEEGEDVSNEQLERYVAVAFPQRLFWLGLTYLGRAEMPIVFPVASRLKKLDLLYAMLDTEGHCLLLRRCPNLEMLQSRNVIGDRGLEVVAQFCKKMKRLRIERGDDEIEDVEGVVSHRGLICVSRGCLELEYLTISVSDITNASLECVGMHLKKLYNFRLVLVGKQETIADFPLDNGVRSLLMGCHKLTGFALYLQPGGLTDVGLSYIGRYSPKVRWMLLGFVGESDRGILEFSKGCPSLQKLEMRGCCFSENALAAAILQLTSLKCLWVQGYIPCAAGWDLVHMLRPNWITEVIPATHVAVPNANGEVVLIENPAQILAYYSLAKQRTDFPSTVRPWVPKVYSR